MVASKLAAGAGTVITAPLVLFLGLFGGSVNTEYLPGVSTDKIQMKDKKAVEFVVSTPTSYDKDEETQSVIILTEEKVDEKKVEAMAESNKLFVVIP